MVAGLFGAGFAVGHAAGNNSLMERTSGPSEATTSASATPAPDAPRAPVETPAPASQRDLGGEVAVNLGYPNLRAACNHGWGFACLIIRVEHTAPGTMTAHVTARGDDIAELLAKNAPAGIDTIITVEPEPGGETHTETARPGEVTA